MHGTQMPPHQIMDSKNWRNLAAEMRLVAAEIADTDGRVIALRVAKDLEWFAEWFDLQNERRPQRACSN
jgi:hypothetical protein